MSRRPIFPSRRRRCTRPTSPGSRSCSSREQLQAFLAALGPARAADVLEYLDEELRTEFLESVTPRQAAELVSEMTPDDRADTLEEIDEDRVEEILSEITTEARRETEQLLSYEADTAGGLMTTEFVSVSADMTVEAALENVRAVARSGKKEAMYAIYTTDTQGRVAGVMSLRELLAAPPGAKIGDIAWTEVVSVSPSADREEVARVIANYDMVAVPVVSESGHVMGVITVDDVIDAIQEEQTEDVQKLGGMEALDEPYSTISFWRMIKKRAGWLSALFLGEMLTATVLGVYQTEIDRQTLLALFLPLIISSGGNSGSQGTSLLIRALALREVTLRDWWRVAGRELATGVTLGLILALIGFCADRAVAMVRTITAFSSSARTTTSRSSTASTCPVPGQHHLARVDRLVLVARRRDLRDARRIDAAVHLPPARLRSRERVGAVHRDVRRLHGAHHLLQRRAPHSASLRASFRHPQR